MVSEKKVPYHKLVKSILADLKAGPKGASLTRESADNWIATLRDHPQRKEIAGQLVVLAQKLGQQKSSPAAFDLVMLAVTITSHDYVKTMLAERGASSKQTRELLGKTHTSPTRPTLSAPTRGGATMRPTKPRPTK